MHFKNTKGLLSPSNGMNIYRGCTHGCIYCDSRSACYHIEHAFEDIEVKANAPELLEDALKRKRNKCMIGTGSMCDPYMPLEADLRYTRTCLELIAKHGFGATLITKSDLVLRDLDLLLEINAKAKCVVQITLTTYDEALCQIVEPNVCTTKRRFEVLQALQKAGIPTVVWLSPILPFINDTEQNLRGILGYCVDAGVKGILCFGFGMTLREGNREYYYAMLDKHFPGLKAKYIQKYGYAYSLRSDNHDRLMLMLTQTCAEHDIFCDSRAVFAYLKTFETPHRAEQLSLF